MTTDSITAAQAACDRACDAAARAQAVFEALDDAIVAGGYGRTVGAELVRLRDYIEAEANAAYTYAELAQDAVIHLRGYAHRRDASSPAPGLEAAAGETIALLAARAERYATAADERVRDAVARSPYREIVADMIAAYADVYAG